MYLFPLITPKYFYLHHLDVTINALGVLVFWVFSEHIFRIYMCFIKSTHLEKDVGTLRFSLENDNNYACIHKEYPSKQCGVRQQDKGLRKKNPDC